MSIWPVDVDGFHDMNLVLFVGSLLDGFVGLSAFFEIAIEVIERECDYII